MSYRKTVLGFFVCCLASTTWCADKDNKIDPAALFARARSVEILWTKGTPPIALRADLQVPDRKGGWVTGKYVFAWESPSQWREEIKFGDYDRLRVGNDKGYWQTSTLNYRPEIIFELDELLQLKRLLRLSPDEMPGKVKLRKRGNLRDDCTEVKNNRGEKRTLCFDKASGTLATVDDATPGLSRIEYTDFNSLAGKMVPYVIRGTNDGRVVAAVKITAVGNLSGNATALFVAPTNAGFWPQCDDVENNATFEPQRPRMPVYPTAAKQNHEQGTVLFYAVIDGDGTVSQLIPIRGPAPDLIASAAEAIRTWRYKPTVCDGKPARRQTQITVVFTLGG